MALTDIFTTPFLISLGITLVLIGLLGIYLTQKLQEQNHKITSMFGLVTSMAEEMNFIRNRFQSGGIASSSSIAPVAIKLDDNQLINVSDGENDSESDDGYDDDDDDDDNSISDSDVEYEDDLELRNADNNNKIKIINISENFTINSSMNDIDIDIDVDNKRENKAEEINTEEIDENDIGDENDADDLSSKSSSSSSSDDLEELVNENSIVIEELNSSDFIKSITMNLENTNIEISDYKKMSLNKLRTLVVEKKLTTSNANKLKKEELLKLLNAE
jgi:hypothetical protein